jgi:DNA-binding IclR family transcriptional regulator
MVFVDQIVGPQRLRAVSAVGETFPLYCTANGKASLTLVEDEAIKRALPAKLGRRTPATITSRGRLISEIAKIRGTGLALDLEEHSPGISALGMAFADSAGIIYAVSVPMPTVRFARSRPACARALQATVRSITSALRTGASS